jgi:hypothetical protein
VGTSGVTTYSTTRDQIITDALLELGVLADGQIPTSAMVNRGARRLNEMVMAWQARGAGLWLNLEVTMPLQYGVASYSLGPSGWHCSASMGETALASAAVSGVTSLTVDDITGMTTGDYIGVQLSTGSMQWTTINGAPSGSTVTLTTGLTASAAIDAVVFFYTSKISRPLGIVEMRVRDVNGIETPMDPISRQEYMALPLKTSTGLPNQYYWDAQIGNGILNVWSTTVDVSYRLVGTIKTPVQVFVNPTDNPNFPQEWSGALVYNLAMLMSPGYRVPNDTFTRIVALAQSLYEAADGFDREQVSTYFTPEMRP